MATMVAVLTLATLGPVGPIQTGEYHKKAGTTVDATAVATSGLHAPAVTKSPGNHA